MKYSSCKERKSPRGEPAASVCTHTTAGCPPTLCARLSPPPMLAHLVLKVWEHFDRLTPHGPSDGLFELLVLFAPVKWPCGRPGLKPRPGCHCDELARRALGKLVVPAGVLDRREGDEEEGNLYIFLL